jgi:hypothetical protein
VQEHEFLYCNRDKKQAAWDELAADLKVDTKPLKTFWDGLRTRFGKLTKKKSGDPAPTFSQRDQWILDILGFVNAYITRKGVSTKIRLRPPKPKVTSTPAQSQSTISSPDVSEHSHLLATMDRCASNTTELLKLQQNSYPSNDFFNYIKKCARNLSPALLDEFTDSVFTAWQTVNKKARMMYQPQYSGYYPQPPMQTPMQQPMQQSYYYQQYA